MNPGSDREANVLAIDRLTAPCAAALQLTVEQEIFDTLAYSRRRLRLWRPLPALVATRAEANRPAFALAAARAADRGLPVYVRRSGGGAVCLGPGSLVVSHFYSSARNDIDGSYRRLAGLLTEAVADLEVSLTAARVAKAYCDGRFDLAWRGLKVGGIAQRRRLQSGIAHVWIHAVLAVEADALSYPEALNTFYADLWPSRVVDPRSTTTLAHCLPPHAASHDLITRVGDAIVRAFEARGICCGSA